MNFDQANANQSALSPEPSDAQFQRYVHIIQSKEGLDDLGYAEALIVSEEARAFLQCKDYEKLKFVCSSLNDLFVRVSGLESKWILFNVLKAFESTLFGDKLKDALSEAAFSILTRSLVKFKEPAWRTLILELCLYIFERRLDLFKRLAQKIVSKEPCYNEVIFEFFVNQGSELSLASRPEILALLEKMILKTNLGESIISLIRLLTLHSEIASSLNPATITDIIAESCLALKTFDTEDKLRILQFFLKLPKPVIRKHMDSMLENEEFKSKLGNKQEQLTFCIRGALLTCLESEKYAVRLCCLRFLSKYHNDSDFSLLIKLSRLFFYFYNDEEIRIRIFAMGFDYKLKKFALGRNIDIDVVNIKDKVYHYDYLAHDKSESVRLLSYKLLSLIKVDYDEGLPWFHKIVEIFQSVFERKLGSKQEIYKIKKALYKFLKVNNVKFGRTFVERNSEAIRKVVLSLDSNQKGSTAMKSLAILFFLESHKGLYVSHGYKLTNDLEFQMGKCLNDLFGEIRYKAKVLQEPFGALPEKALHFYACSFDQFVANFEPETQSLHSAKNYSALVAMTLKEIQAGIAKYIELPIKQNCLAEFEYNVLTLIKANLIFKLAYIFTELSSLSPDTKMLIEKLAAFFVTLYVVKLSIKALAAESTLMEIYTRHCDQKFKGLSLANFQIDRKTIEDVLLPNNRDAQLYKKILALGEELNAKIKDNEQVLRKSLCRIKQCYLVLSSASKIVARRDGYETIQFKIQQKKAGLSRPAIKLFKQRANQAGEVVDAHLELPDQALVQNFSLRELLSIGKNDGPSVIVKFVLVKAFSKKSVYPISNPVTLEIINPLHNSN